MSILLEALKKSEQERQLGQTPTLQTPAEARIEGNGSPSPWVALAMILTSVAIMAWFGWQQFRMPENAAPASTASGTVVEQTNAAAPSPQARTLTEGFEPAQEASRQADIVQPAAPENPPAERSRLSQSVSTFRAEEEAVDSEPEAPVAAPGAEPGRVGNPPARSAADPQADEIATTGDRPRRGVEPHVADPISYWELPQGIRDNLPEIKITVLVYAERPGDRFVLSNGQRLVEKDELDSGLVLEEIRKDGAVFLYRNYRFLVKG